MPAESGRFNTCMCLLTGARLEWTQGHKVVEPVTDACRSFRFHWAIVKQEPIIVKPRQVISQNLTRNVSFLKCSVVQKNILPHDLTTHGIDFWRVSKVKINFTRRWCSKMKIGLTAWRGVPNAGCPDALYRTPPLRISKNEAPRISPSSSDYQGEMTYGEI